jgi:hypothetical protein
MGHSSVAIDDLVQRYEKRKPNAEYDQGHEEVTVGENGAWF